MPPHGLQDLSSLTRDGTPVHGMKGLSPNHWTTREFPLLYSLHTDFFFFLNKWGFPGGSVAKNLPSSMGHASSVPGLGGSTWRGATKPVGHNYWACALEPRSPNYWAHIAVTPEACLPAPEPVLCNKKAHHKQKPSHCNLESSPNSLELEHELSNEDPEQPKISK